MIDLHKPTRSECLEYLPVVVQIAASGTFAALEVDEPMALSTVMEWLDDPARFIRVARVDGQPAGMIIGYVQRQWFSLDYTAHDTLLFVAPAYRGQGIAAALIADYAEWAEAKGAKLTFLASSTGIETEAAVAIYKGIGFEYVGPIYVRENNNV